MAWHVIGKDGKDLQAMCQDFWHQPRHIFHLFPLFPFLFEFGLISDFSKCTKATVHRTKIDRWHLLHKMLPPEQAAQLLPWYMRWSNELAVKMHCRHLVQNEACHNVPAPSSHDCSCDSEWWCEPHNACFIHHSCFCPGFGSFPPVKPPHILLSPHSF